MTKTNQAILLGCICDDFTGATDAASFLVKGGLRTTLINDVPAEDTALPEDCEAVVIALKTRTQQTDAAVRTACSALSWLQARNVRHFYIKYCSTFDSRPEGNIGPIVDAAMRQLGVPYTLLCPSLPANGRTVSGGRLFVNGVPLNESPMRDHPLTPMWDDRIAELMRRQGAWPCYTIERESLAEPSKLAWIAEQSRRQKGFYLVPDYETDEDAAAIIRSFGTLRLLSGGSGLLEFWAKALRQRENGGGRQLILAGSCSVATHRQIEAFQKAGYPSLRISPELLADGRQSVESLWEHISSSDVPMLLYSSDTPENVRKAQRHGQADVSALLERTTAELAARAVEAGYAAVIVAGGETSGAVIRRLPYTAYGVGASIAPGVPVITPVENPGLRLVLKSGNFGSEQFFLDALRMTRPAPAEARRLAEQAVRICRTLFALGHATGSTSNISFRVGDEIYVSASGTSFGTIRADQFVRVGLDAAVCGSGKPSKEYPLHLAVYRARPDVNAVLHTHSFYSTLLSCLPSEHPGDCVREYTPYLRMKLGKIARVPYAPPGSRELFELFEQNIDAGDGWLLANHGPVVPAKNLNEAFYCLEELEESCRLAWELRNEPDVRTLPAAAQADK